MKPEVAFVLGQLAQLVVTLFAILGSQPPKGPKLT